jgi:hypothetical protein
LYKRKGKVSKEEGNGGRRRREERKGEEGRKTRKERKDNGFPVINIFFRSA